MPEPGVHEAAGVTPALELDRITKRYDSIAAVAELSLKVMPGQIFGLLGPNGAGKTSAIRMMLGIIAPDSGAVRLFGMPPGRGNPRRAGYLPEERGLYARMSVRDNLIFFGRLSGLDTARARQQAERWAARLDLAGRLDDKIEQLSKGLQQKVQFIAAVLHDPEFIVVDEPFTALDPVNVSQIREILSGLRTQGRTIILSTHRMDQVEQLCDSICLIDRGRAVVAGSLRAIKSRHPARYVEIDYEGDEKLLQDNPLVSSWKANPNGVEVKLTPGADPQELLRAATGAGRVRRFEIKEPGIEQIFVDLVSRDRGDD